MVTVEFLKNAQNDPRFAPYFEKAEAEYTYLKTNFADSPDYLSGWFHDFYCPHCAAQLDFDPLVAHHAFCGKNRYHCSACGNQTEGNDTLDEAWVYSYRIALAKSLPAAALYALLGDRDALELMIKFVDFYADHYHLFPVHGKHAGRGKIMAQSLDEAVFLLAVLRGLFPVRQMISPKKQADWHEKLFLPLCEFLLSQTDFHQIHNIALWMRCAVGGAALFTEDETLLSRALEPPYGIRAQVEEGYTKDGIWNECSFHYHYYATEGFTEFLLYYREKAPNDPLFERLLQAYVSPAAFSHDGYTISSLSDGWYPLSLKRYALQIVTAAEILRHPALMCQLSALKEKDPESLICTDILLHSGDALQDMSTPVLPSSLPCEMFEDSRLAVLRRPFTAIFRVGNRRFSHMHDDYLSLVLPGISDDLGTPGYAHPMTNAYYRRSHSHNTLCADGKSQPHEYRDTVISAVPGGVQGDAEALWEGIDASRTLTFEQDALCDRLTAVSADAHTYDWFFHVQGKRITNGKDMVSPMADTVLPYTHLTEIQALGQGKGRCLSFETPYGILDVEICSEAQLFLAKSPSNPAYILRETVLLRIEAPTAEFLVRYRLR